MTPEIPGLRHRPTSSRARSGSALLAILLVIGCAASPQTPTSAEYPASQGPAMQPGVQQAPAPFESSKTPGIDSGSRTVGDAATDFSKAEKDLTDALDPTKAVPMATDRCAIVCKALASMRNAAGHLCELTSDDRCDDARSRLAKAESRAKEACPVCAAT